MQALSSSYEKEASREWLELALNETGPSGENRCGNSCAVRFLQGRT